MAFREGLFKSDRFTEKERRNLAILDIIRRTKEISRAEISRITRLNIVTISNYIDDYISKGLVLEKGFDVSSGGRRPELLEVNLKYGYCMGIDLGSPHVTEEACITAVILDASGKIVGKARAKKAEEPQEKFISRIADIAGDALRKSHIDKEKIKGIGIGIWGVLDRYKGTTRYAVEKGGLFSYTALQSVLENEFGVPTLVEHDATAGALGEKWIGLGLNTEAENIIYMCSDSSCGLILNGELYYGSSRSAGELNINPPAEGSKDDACWAKYDYGCGFRSRGIDLGISSRAKHYLSGEGPTGSKILELARKDPNGITFSMVVEAGREDDEVAKKLLTEAGDYLGAKIAFMINLFNPDAVVIGRGIEKAGDVFMDALRNSIKKWAYEESFKMTRVLPTMLGEDSIACGAAALVMQRLFARI